MKWFGYTGASSVVASGLVACLLCSTVTADSTASKTAGTSAGNAVLQKYGTKENVKKNLAVPMTSGGTQLQTIDSTKSFSVGFGTPSSNSFLQLLIQPTGTGDLGMVTVAQDLDSDGAFDNTFNLGVPVSGVCANGFVSCNPGTWNACQPYKWISDNQGKLSIEPVAVTRLGGCYCINSSCGSSLVWSNSALILKDLGGGAVGAIHAQDATVMITNVASDPVSITYYGNLLKKATTANSAVPANQGAASVQQQQAYFGNWSQLSNDAAGLSLTQSSNGESMYSKVKNSVATQNGVSTKTCQIKRTGVLTTVPLASFTSTGSSSLCTDHLIYMMVKKVDETKFELKLLDTSPGGAAHHNCNDNPGGDGWHLQHTINLPVIETGTYQAKLTKALYSITNIQGAGCNSGGSASMDAAISGFNVGIAATAPCPAKGAQTPSFDWSYLFEFEADSYQEGVTNGCAAFEADANCTPREEVVDGVTTMINGNPTGLNPLPTQKTYIGAVAPMEISRDWWEKKRTYSCIDQNMYDLSAAGKRFDPLVTSVDDTVNAINYSDLRKDSNGAWIASTGSIALPGRDLPADCEQACQVRKNKQDTQIGANGVMSEARETSSSHDDVFRICVDNGTTCPVEAGETIVANCKCTDQFSSAATVMQSLRMAGNDNICASGTPVQP